MKTSFSTLACADYDLPHILELARTHGFDGVELRGVSSVLDLWKLPAFSGDGLQATQRLIQSSGLEIPVLGSSASFHSPDREERKRQEEDALRMAEIAATLGARAVRVFGDRIQTGCTHEDTQHWIAESLARLIERVQGTGVSIWLETHGDFSTAPAVKALLAEPGCSTLGIVWDAINAFVESGEIPTAENSPANLQHVHVKDLVKTVDKFHYVLPGVGDFPLNALLSVLDAKKFSGYLSFEWERWWHPELASAEEALPAFMHWWKQRTKA